MVEYYNQIQEEKVNSNFKFQRPIEKPYNIDDFQEILKKAKKEREKIKIVTSKSDLKFNQIPVSLDNFASLLRINLDNKTVKVESGMKIQDLNTEIDEWKLGLPNLPGNYDETAYSIIEKGLHGTGKSFGILSTLVTEIELLIASGEVLTLSNSENPEIFKAALCNLGCLGIPGNIESI